jgi:hypothetical protein
MNMKFAKEIADSPEGRSVSELKATFKRLLNSGWFTSASKIAPLGVNIPIRLPKLLKTAVQTFAAQHPDLAVKKTARDRCREASIAFCDLLREMGYTGPLAIEELAVVGGTSHRAAFVLGYWIDWTARQYDPNAPWPAVAPEQTKWHYADHLRRRGFDVY